MKFRQTIISAVTLLAICGAVLAHADEPAPYVDEDAVREAAINQHITSTCKAFSSAILKGEKPRNGSLISRDYRLQIDEFRSDLGLQPTVSAITEDEKSSLAQTEQQITETCKSFIHDVVSQIRTEETRSKLQAWLRIIEAEDPDQRLSPL